jgi:shikimate dehydrogenase
VLTAHRAAVCGKPIGHSLSPVIHTAGFAAAGLLNWTYTAIECDAAGLPGLVHGLGPEWVGLSLTMPLKEVALTLASSASPAARVVGVANTLVRQEDGSWHADNTDIAGMVRVLRDAGVPDKPGVTVLGGGGTARAALAAAARLGATEVTVATRRPAAMAELAPVAEALEITLTGRDFASVTALESDAVISTVPKGAADELALTAAWRPGTVLFDAIYDPWPTPLAAAADANGVRVASGLDLLLAQALGQFELFTGVVPAPEAPMRAALTAAAAMR